MIQILEFKFFSQTITISRFFRKILLSPKLKTLLDSIL